MRTALILSATIAAQAQAADQSAGAERPAADDQIALTEVVVTASKRPEASQRSAQSLTVITADSLEKTGATSVDDLSQIAPDLNFSQRGASTMIELRGISSRGYDERSDPAISISVDGTYLQRSTTLDAALFDVDRVELLRGPQGVLYGRDAVGGALNIISAAPVNDLRISGAIQAGNYGAQREEAMLNLPVTDTLAVRFAGFHDQHNGYRDNTPAQPGDDQDESAGRVSLRWKPTDQFTATLIGEYVRQREVGPVRLGVPIEMNQAGYLGDRSSTSLISSDSSWPLDKTGATNVTASSARWSAAYDFGPASLSYTGGYSHQHVFRDEDYDGTESPLSDQFGFPQDSRLDIQTHEIRLTSNGDTRFSYQLGGYYFEQQEILWAAFTQPYANGVYLPTWSYDYSTQPGYGVVSQSRAAFGQIGYKITDSIKVEAGLRHTSDHKTQVGSENSLFYNADNSLASIDYTPENLHADSSKSTYHVGVEDQLTGSNMVYAKYDTGYKAGGFTEVNAYGPETISAVEIGSKNRFLDDKMQLNVAAFYYDYKNQQVQEFVNNNVTTVNAGVTKIYGAEGEGRFIFTRTDRADASLAWLHARFTDFVYNTSLLPSTLGNGNVQLAGNTPIQSPTWTFNAGYEHDFFIGSSRVNARMQTHIETSSHLSVLNNPGDQQPAYTRSDFLLTLYPGDSHYYVQGYVRNLENTMILTEGEPNGFTGNWFYQFAPPRTYGLRVAIDY